jgi:hypothetical protein
MGLSAVSSSKITDRAALWALASRLFGMSPLVQALGPALEVNQ